MTPNKQQITTDEEIMEAYAKAFTQVVGRPPTWGQVGSRPSNFTQIFRKLLSEYELVAYRVKNRLGVVVEVTEENGTTSRFVNVADEKWYCDGRPTGSRFLNTKDIERMNPRPHRNS